MHGPYPLDEAAVSRLSDRFLKWHTGAGPDRWFWHLNGRSTAVVAPRRGRHGCLVLGAPDDVPGLVDEVASWLAGQGITEFRLSLSPEADGRVPPSVRADPSSRWEWMWTTTVPDVGGPPVTWLGDDEHDEVATLLALSPSARARPGDPDVRAWAGVRRGGRLVAIGALCVSPAGTPHLRAIVTVPRARGEGLGSAVTAFLTRAGLQESPLVSLGMYSDNDVARRLYQRLGYVTSHRWVSAQARLITSASPPSA